MMDIQFELEDILKKKVDLVEYHLIKPRLRPYILKDQVKNSINEKRYNRIY